MKCPSMEEMAALYDGTLPKRVADPIRDHLALCARCAQEFRVLHDTLSNLAKTPAAPVRLINLVKKTTLESKPDSKTRKTSPGPKIRRPNQNAYK